MKLWMRMLIGVTLGLFLGAYLPVAGRDGIAIMQVLAGLVVNIGRYALYPVVFFGVVVGVHELRADRLTGAVFAKAGAATVALTAVLVPLGTLLTLFLSGQRIPPIFQESAIPAVPSVAQLAAEVFPRNLFAVFAGSGDFLLPVAAAALFIGLVLHHEGSTVGPGVDLMDSLARVSYRLNAWFLEAVSVGLIAISAAWLMQLRTVSDLQLFAPLIWLLVGVTALFVVVGYPALAYFLGGRYGPFAWLYALVGPVLVAFFSGDSYFALGALTRVAKENYGISREASAPVLTLTTLFAKAGSAMVIAASFITVLRSYTALEIGFLQVVWIMGASFLISFLLGRVPGATVIVGLSVLSRAYGQGMSDIYLILLPVLPILTGIAVAIDTMSSALVALLVAVWERKRRIVDVLDFI